MNFIKTFLAAVLAFFVANLLWIFLVLFVLVGVVGLVERPARLAPGTVLVVDLSTPIRDAPSFGNIDPAELVWRGGTEHALLLFDVLRAVEAAASDPKIEGIYLRTVVGGIGMEAAVAEELRTELEHFRESGKFIVGYGESYSQPAYWLASVADDLYLNPEGMFDWRGVALQVLFYKGLLDKLGIVPEVFRHGAYKSTVEPFIQNRMSDESRRQSERYARSLWGVMVGDVAASRQIAPEALDAYANRLEVVLARDAVERKLVDGLRYEDEVLSDLAERVGAESVEKMERISLEHYALRMGEQVKNVAKNRVEIIYADGEIITGENGRGILGSESFIRSLRRARDDERIKAVVVRVNSPGGSALAAESMWREVSLLKEQKPVIVSMGAYAASGGYYISCPADAIIADRTTLTGSIGVFGITFDVGKTLKEHVGITVEVAGTGPGADMGSLFRPVSAREREVLMQGVERVYNVFVGHVAEGRNLSVERVDSLGGGRIWTGLDAVELGLADANGGLRTALAVAVEKADLGENYQVVSYLPESTRLEKLLAQLETRVSVPKTDPVSGMLVQAWSRIRRLADERGVQALCPYRWVVE